MQDNPQLVLFAVAPENRDEIFYSRGIEIYVSKASLSRLQESIIDYLKDDAPSEHSELILKEHFHIKNPNVRGCLQSLIFSRMPDCQLGASHEKAISRRLE
jgi:Fe-S cluster assembly iron-binding protein IscA